MAEHREPRSLQEAVLFFADAQRCHDFLTEARWPDGEVACPYCGSTTVKYMPKYRRWYCGGDHDTKQFSIKVGSIFEDSPLPLQKWLPAVWMLVNCKNGISSYELHRAIKVTQKTAWFMLQRIRLAMQTGTFEKVAGHVEIDETFIGGKARFMHKDVRARKIKGTGGAGKVAVMGLLQRHGKKGHSTVKTVVLNTRRKAELGAAVRLHVEPKSQIFTDELPSYNDLAPDYVHNVINHAEEYVRGNVHTNGIENFWSLLKRAIRGTYVSVEPFHLFRYLDEQAFRFNERKDDDGDQGRFRTVTGQLWGKRLTYKVLIGDAEPVGGPA
ncbi:MAG: IS1595 family transposase [bacterium]